MTQEFTRATARKVTIALVNTSTFIKEQGEEQNYILTNTKEKITRITIVGIIVTKELVGTVTNILLDDGTDKIILRCFEYTKTIDTLHIGDPLLVIGKVREFNDEKYLAPEIIKKIDPLWLKVWSIERGGKNLDSIKYEHQVDIKENHIENSQPPILPFEKILHLIKKQDKGEGVAIEQVIQESTIENTEEIIEKLLEKGDIFQNSPGKVKVL